MTDGCRCEHSDPGVVGEVASASRAGLETHLNQDQGQCHKLNCTVPMQSPWMILLGLVMSEIDHSFPSSSSHGEGAVVFPLKQSDSDEPGTQNRGGCFLCYFCNYSILYSEQPHM